MGRASSQRFWPGWQAAFKRQEIESDGALCYYDLDQTLHSLYGAHRAAAFLVRPDGYLASQEISQQDPYREQVAVLRGFRGVDTLTAMVFITELGDIRRFASPRQLMSYLGLVPALHQSGKSGNTATGITRAGNRFLRHVMVQASWTCENFPGNSEAGAAWPNWKPSSPSKPAAGVTRQTSLRSTIGIHLEQLTSR